MKYRFLFSLIVLCFSVNSIQAQFKKLTTFNTPHTIIFAAIDRAGEVYLISDKNNIDKISSEGNIVASATLNTTPTLFDPRDGSHLFVYSRKDQTYEFLQQDLQPNLSRTKIDSSFAIDPYLVSPSGDHDLIILDSADLSLKKISGKTNVVLYETIIFDSTTAISSIKNLREYQNFIFMLEKEKGILIFNMMGKLLKTIPGKNIDYFNFLGEELYYQEKDTLHFFDFFTAEKRSLKLPAPARFAFLTDERLFLINKNKVEVFSYSPN